MSRIRRKRVLEIVLTDHTFLLKMVRNSVVWVGRCIHCDRKLMVNLDGSPLGPITIEHIHPRNHGGLDEVENLALACARCNNIKGYRLDHLPIANPRLAQTIEKLKAIRKSRWREPTTAPDPASFRSPIGT